MDGLTVFEAKSVRSSRKRKREDKGDPGDVDGYKGPWREYVDQVKVAQPTDEEKAALEIMFASKKKEKKEEGQTIEESTMLHGEGSTFNSIFRTSLVPISQYPKRNRRGAGNETSSLVPY